MVDKTKLWNLTKNEEKKKKIGLLVWWYEKAALKNKQQRKKDEETMFRQTARLKIINAHAAHTHMYVVIYSCCFVERSDCVRECMHNWARTYIFVVVILVDADFFVLMKKYIAEENVACTTYVRINDMYIR